MASIYLGNVYPTSNTTVYKCYLNYESITRSGTSIIIKNANIGISRDSGVQYTTNRIAAWATIGGKTLVAKNTQYRPRYSAYDGSSLPDPEGDPWAKYSSNVTLTINNVTGTTISYAVIVRGTGGWTSWDNPWPPPTYTGTQLSVSGNITVPAVPVIDTYSVNYNGNGNTSGTVPTSHTNLASGTKITLKSGSSLKKSASVTYTAIFNANGGTTTKTSQNATATATASFNKWHLGSSSGTAYNSGANYTVSSNVTFYAGYGTATTTYQKIKFPTTSQCKRDHYTLLGFSSSSSATSATYSPGQEVELKTNITLYAVWKRIVFTVSYNKNGGTSGTTPTSQNVNSGDTVTIPNTNLQIDVSDVSTTLQAKFDANGGNAVSPINVTKRVVATRKFDHWDTKSDGSGTNFYPGDKPTPTKDTVLYAIYKTASYVTTYTPSEITLPSATRANYTFNYWVVGSHTYNAGTRVALTQTITFTASWTRITYTMSFVKNGGNSGGSNWPANRTVNSGDTFTLPNTNIFITDSDVSTDLAVTFNTNGGSAVQNKVVTKRVVKTRAFKNWRDGSASGTERAVGYSFTITGNKTFYANYDSVVTTTTYSPASITLPTTSCKGYRFLGWKVGSNTQLQPAGASINITAATTITAQWQPLITGNFVLRTTKNTSTWAQLVNEQKKSTASSYNDGKSTLYDAGGSDNLWSIKNGKVYFANALLKKGNADVLSTDRPDFSATYTYYNVKEY